MKNKTIIKKLTLIPFYILFCIVPAIFFILNFESFNKYLYYGVIFILIVISTLFMQFFYEEKSIFSKDKTLILLITINTIVLSFVSFTGGTNGILFFLIYLLLFLTTIFIDKEILLLEMCIVLISLIFQEKSKEGFMFSIKNKSFQSIVSVISLMPFLYAVSVLLSNFRAKIQMLSFAKNLLLLQEIEDKALMQEINEGIMILDKELKIIKVSEWVVKQLGISTDRLLGQSIKKIELYDAVTNQKFDEDDLFIQNFYAEKPQKLKWRVLFKNEYSKFIKFFIKVKPIFFNNEKVGFLITFELPPQNIFELVNSSEGIFNFRLSSILVSIRNAITLSKNEIKTDNFVKIENRLRMFSNLLNDNIFRNNITDGFITVSVKEINVVEKLFAFQKELGKISKINIWTVFPLYKNQGILMKTDESLFDKMLLYILKGCIFFSVDNKVNISIDQDSVTQKPSILFSIDSEVTEGLTGEDILKPFFGGKILAISKYKGTGLEFSNAFLVSKILNVEITVSIIGKRIMVKMIIK